MAETTSVPKRILLVDDEPSVLDSISRMLRFDGHSVEIATGGDQALILFKEGQFDLVVLDYQMTGLRGDEVATRIHALDAAQPILMMTGHVEGLMASGASLTGVDLVIGKPFGLEELRRAVGGLGRTK